MSTVFNAPRSQISRETLKIISIRGQVLAALVRNLNIDVTSMAPNSQLLVPQLDALDHLVTVPQNGSSSFLHCQMGAKT